MEPNQKDLDALGRRFFGGVTHHGRPLEWSDMSESEQAASLREWQREQEARTASLAAAQSASQANAKGSRTAFLTAIVKGTDERIRLYMKHLPRLMERDLSALIGRVYREETRQQDARINDLVARVAERCDVMAGHVSKMQGQGARLASVDQFTMELQTRISELEASVKMLKAQVEGRSDGFHH